MARKCNMARKSKIVVEELPGRFLKRGEPKKYKVVQTVNCTEPSMHEYITQTDIDQLLEADDSVEVTIKPWSK